MAWFNFRKSKHAPELQVALYRLLDMKWPDFEALTAEAFRQRGYSVEKTGKGGLEGDIDLILRKDGRTELVQCKQWKTRKVGVAVVREMWAVMRHREADAVKIVSAGVFAEAARQFAEGKPVELIDGERLLDLVRAVRVPPPENATGSQESTAGPTCPDCDSLMFKRFNRQTNQMFWSCIKYPVCKGMRPL